MPRELYGLMAQFSLKFQKFICLPKIFLIMKANSFALSVCQCKETRDNYEDNLGKKQQKRRFKVRLIHAFSEDMEILPFLAVLFKTGTATSILGSWMPAVRAREKHSYPCRQMPLPINQKAAPGHIVLCFQITEIIMSE